MKSVTEKSTTFTFASFSAMPLLMFAISSRTSWIALPKSMEGPSGWNFDSKASASLRRTSGYVAMKRWISGRE